MGKYAKVRDGLASTGLASPASLVEPEPAAWDDLALVHTGDYLQKTRDGGFRASELALLELPWSREVAEGFRLMAGGTIAAARLAVEARRRPKGGPVGGDAGAPRLAAAANLGGGFHHAFPSHGEGFCLYNDVAVAVRVLQRDGVISRAAVVDVDVHQGNGTAFIFEGDASVFTFSIHQEHNYPHVKPRGSLDVGLPDGTGDREYLHALERALPVVLASRPDLIVYVAGADPYVDDQLGGLCLTYEGLRGRDFLVLSSARDAGVPAVIVFAGGYARRVEDTAAIHIATIEEAVRLGA
jgi:acetoin utilization deacetylase AcuC-like enzyme